MNWSIPLACSGQNNITPTISFLKDDSLQNVLAWYEKRS
jgi:hypothetical protein